MKMQYPQPKYKFYATLLDAFNWYQVSECENAEQELLDKINRVPVTDPKALERMNRGTALNNLIDTMIRRGFVIHDETIVYDGFEFKANIVNDIAKKLRGSVIQYYAETMIHCDGVNVLVYGYIDYILHNKVIDLKTTSNYDLGKYKDSMQMHLYPIALFNKANVIFEEFEFLVVDDENIYSETYPISLIDSNTRLTVVCNQLIKFIESKKHLITDKKIFNE